MKYTVLINACNYSFVLTVNLSDWLVTNTTDQIIFTFAMANVVSFRNFKEYTVML